MVASGHRPALAHSNCDLVNPMSNTTTSTSHHIRQHGARNRSKEAKEKVVKGQGTSYRAHPQHNHQQQPHLTYSSTPQVKDKANHVVVLDKATNEKLQKDVQSYRLVTVAVLVDRLKINGSLARAALKDLEERGVIKKVVSHSAGNIYSELDCIHNPCRGDADDFAARAVGGGD